MIASPESPHRGRRDEERKPSSSSPPRQASPLRQVSPPRQAARGDYGVSEALGNFARTAVLARRSVKEFSKALNARVEAASASGSKAVSDGQEALAKLDNRLGVSDRVGSAVESVGAGSVRAWSALDERFGLSKKMSDADEKLGLTKQRTSLLERLSSGGMNAERQGDAGGGSSGSGASSPTLRGDLVEDFAQRVSDLRSKGEANMQRAWTELNKAIVKTTTSVSQLRTVVGALDPSALCFYDAKVFPGVEGCVALTIDDAPCRQPDSERSMLPEVRELLAEFGAKATFFLCTDFVSPHEDELRELIRSGHEVANHCGADRPYGGDGEKEFEAQLLDSEAICNNLRLAAELQDRAAVSAGTEDNDLGVQESAAGTSVATAAGEAATVAVVPPAAPGQAPGAVSPPPVIPFESLRPLPPLGARWFRAPHADTSDDMRRVLQRHGFTNVLCDCFANDTVISDPSFIADALLSLVDSRGGSIVVIHVPERGFREHNLEALRGLLEGLRERQMRVMTVSELTEAARAGGVREASS